MFLLNVAAVIYWGSILLALLNYGAVTLLTVTLLSFPVFVLLLALLLWRGLPRHAETTIWLSAFVLALAVAWIAFQTVPLPNGIFAQPAWRDVQDLLPGTQPTISVTPADDWANALRIAVPLGVFMVGMILFSTDERAIRALALLSISGGVVAFLSIAQFLVAPDTLLFGEKTAYKDSLTGFFVNRNTAATYFGLVVLLGCAMVCRAAGGIEIRRVVASFEKRGVIADDQKRQVWRTCLHGVLLLLSVVALMLTNSRAGIGSTFVAVLFLMLLTMLRPPRGSASDVFGRPRKSGRKVFISIIAFFAVSLAFFSLAGRVLWRAEVRGGEDDRFCVMPGIFQALRDNFPFGTGLSSFIEVFPAYRDPQCGIVNVWDMAHNVYLEGLFTFGGAFVLLATLVMVWLVRALVIGLRVRRRLRFAGEVGAASLLLIAIHSGFDFSLQISGLAIFYAAMLAPIVTICLRPPGDGARNGRSSSKSSGIPREQHLRRRKLPS